MTVDSKETDIEIFYAVTTWETEGGLVLDIPEEYIFHIA